MGYFNTRRGGGAGAGPGAALDSPAFFVALAGDGGSDGNPGTQAQPWATLQHAADNAVAGYTIYVRGGTYSQTTVSLSVSGTNSSNMVKWKPEPGTGQVWIRHNTAVKLYDAGAQIIEGPVSYNRFEGLGFGGPSGSLTAQGIRLQSSNASPPDFNTTFPDCHHNQIVNCTFSNIGHDGTGGAAIFAMIFFAWGSDNLAEGNTIDSCYGMMIRTSTSYLETIRNNTITNMKAAIHDGADPEIFPPNAHSVWIADVSTTWEPSSTLKQGGYHIVEDNLIDGSDGTAIDSGIRMDSGAHNHTIRRNTVKNLTGGYGIFPESRVMNCLIYDNIVYNCEHGFSTSHPSIGRTQYHTVVNNVFYNCDLGMVFRKTGDIFTANNIVAGCTRSQIVTTTDAVGQNNVWNNNLYFKSGNSNIGAWNISDINIDTVTANRTLTQWNSDSGETNSVGTDPSFVNPPTDFHLNGGSPAIDAGDSTLNTATITYSRSFNGSAPDIGRYET